MLDLINNNLAVSLVSLVVGALITTVVTKLHNKTAVFRYSHRIDRVALSAEDPIFGSVKITWQGQPVRNLYTATIEVENSTTRDFEKVNFKVYTGTDTILLNERTAIINSPYIVEWSPEFKQRLQVPDGQTATPVQLNTYYHSREYFLPVFNRGRKLQFTYLCTKPSADDLPTVFVDTLLPGGRLKFEDPLAVVWGVPIKAAIMRGLIISVVAVVVLGFYLKGVWPAIASAFLVGLFAQLLGTVEYKLERFLKGLIAG